MRPYIALFMGFILHVGGSAQPFSVRNDYNGAMGSEAGLKVFVKPYGYQILQGGYSTANAFFRICFVDVSNTGTVAELGSFGRDSLTCFPGAANGPTQLGADSYVFGGTDDGIHGRSVLWRFGPGPDSLWTAQIYGDTVDWTTGRSVRSSNGQVVTTGEVYHSGQSGQLFLGGVDTVGTLVSLHEYGTSVRNQAWSLDTCFDGGYVLGGDAWFSTLDHDAYVVKTDAAGNELWHQYLGGPYGDLFASVIQARDTAYVVVGATSEYNSGSVDFYRLYAARLDAVGDPEWERNYGLLSSANFLVSVAELNDGSFIAAGALDAVGGARGALLHFAANGDSLWLRSYRHPPLDSVFSTHWLYHATQDSDGSIVATGLCTDGQQDLWVIRVDSFGCLVPGCQLYDHVAEQAALPGQEDLHILAYPNPVHDRLAISFRSAATPTGAFRLYDAQGRVIRKFAPGGRSEEIDLDVRPHPPGLYVLHYADRRGTHWSQRIVIE